MTTESPKQPIKGVTDTLLLAVISCYGPVHGYGIAQTVSRLTEGDIILKEGTLYPTLQKLENQHLLTSRWEDRNGRPPRRYYDITQEGRRELSSNREKWRQFSTAFNQVIDSNSASQRS